MDQTAVLISDTVETSRYGVLVHTGVQSALLWGFRLEGVDFSLDVGVVGLG